MKTLTAIINGALMATGVIFVIKGIVGMADVIKHVIQKGLQK